MEVKPASGLRVVSIGGGTGLSTLLSGLKKYVGMDGGESHWIDVLTAVVTVTDDGGSSGRLREEFQMLAPGDIRNCIVGLAEDEHLLTRLLRYRFTSNGGLSGHSFGNLLLTALTNITGDFLEAIPGRQRHASNRPAQIYKIRDGHPTVYYDRTMVRASV